MIPAAPDLPPLAESYICGLWQQSADYYVFAQKIAEPLLAKLDAREAEIERLRKVVQAYRDDFDLTTFRTRVREKWGLELNDVSAALQEADELRAKLEAAQKDADEASANFYCERCGCSYCLEAEVRYDIARGEKP